MSVLEVNNVRDSLSEAWRRSEPGTPNAHEEGGFIVRRPTGELFVIGWPKGAQNQILVPPHPQGTRGNMPIVATFHTHPNIGPGFQQEPSLTDIRAVRDDPDLCHPDYEGEFVIAEQLVYLIRRNGQVEVVGDTRGVLGIL
jgi:hypothetical protein